MTTSDKATIEAWVAIDADGDYAIGPDRDTTLAAYADQIGATEALRVVKINLKIALPVDVEIDLDVADDAGELVEVSTDEEAA